MSSKRGEIKSRPASGRASVPTPPVKFPIHDDKRGQLSRRYNLGKPAKKSRGFSGWLISFASRFAIFYIIYAALWTCPSRPFAFDYSAKDARPVCRNIAQAHEQIVPLVKPYVQLAQQKADPYTRPVIQAATPWVRRANKVVRPIYREANKRGRLIWKKRIDPARRRATKKAQKQIDPYLQQAHQYHKKNVQPHIDTVHKAVKPYQDIYQRDVSPYVEQAYQYSLQSSSVSYAFYMDKVHPHIVKGVKQVYSFLVNHVNPAVRRFYSLYVRPHVEKLLEKVYERKAHYLGSDAIKAAKHEAKQTAHEADKQAKEAVKKAEQDAIKAQTDPSLLDRVKQGKDAVVGSATGESTDPVKTAQLDAELEAEEAKVKELLEVWENGMSDLIDKEYKLAVERIADLRNRRLADLPDRFGLVNEAFVEDTVALILNRIERGLRKLSSSSSDVSEKLAAGKKLVDQQVDKFDEAALDTKAQISAFYEELLQQERQAVETSSAEVRRYAAAAKEAYDGIMKDAKFSATMDEWAGWDLGVRKRASVFAEDLTAVQSGDKAAKTASGAIDLQKEAPDMQKEVNALRSYSDKLHSAARKELVAYSNSALAQLGGTGVAAKISDVTDRLAEQASRISTDAAAGMLGAVGAARSKLGLKETAKEEGYLAKARSYVASGVGSGSSFDDYMSSLSANAAAAGSSASSIAAQASSSVASAVGGGASSSASGVVADAASSVRSAAAAATDAAGSAASSASSAASKASRSAASAVGATPSPETFDDYVDAFTAGVESAVDTAMDRAAAATSSVASFASKVSRSAASAVGASSTPETVGDYAEAARDNVYAAASSASSLASKASRSAASAVGATPSPETFDDYVDAAVDGAAAATSSIASFASQVSKSAASAVGGIDVGAAAQSGASSASSIASSVASSASSLASKASRSVASAVGATPSPETFGDYVDAALGNAAAATSSVASLASKASRSAASAVGASVSPESPREYVEAAASAVSSGAGVVYASGSSLADEASSSASVVYASGSSVASSAASVASSSGSSLASKASKSAASVAGTPIDDVTNAANTAASSASSLASKASRSAASAVGASPTPETVQDYLDDAKDAANSVASAASSAASKVASKAHIEL